MSQTLPLAPKKTESFEHDAGPTNGRTRRVRVHWLAWHPTPYLEVLFRAVAAHERVDLTVHYRSDVLDTHPWRSDFGDGYHSRPLRARFGADAELLRRVLREPHALFIVNGWADSVGILTILALQAAGRRYAVWTDTPATRAHASSLWGSARRAWRERVLARATAVLGMGRTATEVLAQMGVPSTKLVDFPAPVDLGERPAPRPARPLHEPLVLVSSGRLRNDVKGYDVALRALAIVRDELGHCPFHYRVAGTGPDHEALATQAAQLGITPHVEFLGWLEPAAMQHFLASGDVFVHPARWEPFGVVIVEAFAAGLPVVATDMTAAAKDRVRDGENGFVVRADDADDLARALLRVHARRDALPAMREAARRTAEEWPPSRNVDALIGVIRAAGLSA